MDTDTSQTSYSSSSIQPTSSKKKFRRKPFNDILSEAVQIAGIENDQEYGLDDLPDLLDTHGRKLKSFIWIG